MKVIRFVLMMLLYIVIIPFVVLIGIGRFACFVCDGQGIKHSFRMIIRGIMSSHRINMLYVRFGNNPSIKDFES